MIVYTIYDHPLDHPKGFVLREWELVEGSTEPEPRRAWYVDTLDDARALVPEGMYRMERDRADDEKIVESWL